MPRSRQRPSGEDRRVVGVTASTDTPAARARPRTPARPSPLLVAAALGAVYIVWGSTYLAIRVGVATLPPFLMAGSRFLLAGALLLGWTAWRGDLRRERIGAPQLRAAAIVGGLLLLGGNGLVSWAEQTVPSGLAALLISSTPLWMALLGRTLFRERLTPLSVAGIVLGFVGVALLVGVGGSGSGAAPIGIAAILVAAFLWGLGSVWSRRLPLPAHPLVATALEMIAGGSLMVAVAIVRGEPAALDLAAVTPQSWAALAYLVVFGSLVAFTAYVWLLANVRTDLVGTYAYVNPLVAVLLGWALLGEVVTASTLLGGAVVVVAVALVVLARGRDRTEEPGLEDPSTGQTGEVRPAEVAAPDQGGRTWRNPAAQARATSAEGSSRPER